MSDENCWLEKKQLIGPDCIGEEIHLMYIVQCYCKSINFVNTICLSDCDKVYECRLKIILFKLTNLDNMILWCCSALFL